MAKNNIVQVKLIAKKCAPSYIWRWEYRVYYKSGSVKTFTDDTVPASVETWISKERELGHMYDLSDTVVGLVGWNPPENKDSKILGGIL